MASLIPGYEYDIFISYRQKDNKGDRWVSEFVEALRTELESTFKEEISVYFDINPHDGLLETHDVDASLKEKLKCLVFIPIISRTYCDSKSFAWEHEFKAFIEQASKDKFGLKVKLPNGNIASRVLPVRIYDLDNSDIKLCESILDSVLRGVEFIYKEPGVNRPLRANEENPQNNLNHTTYRNQINKVANAVKEIITAIGNHKQKHEEIQKEIPEPITFKGKSNKMKIIAGSLILVALIAIGFFFVPKLQKSKDQLTRTIAVLPFINVNPSDTNNPIINGISRDISSNLQSIKDLSVVSQYSVGKYKDPSKYKIREIAKDLGVNYLVTGTGQKYGTNLILRVELIDALNDRTLWSKPYQQEVYETKDIFGIQSQIAKAIAAELKATISPEEKQLIDKTPTTSLTAYDFYQRGRDEHTKYWLDYKKRKELENAENLYHQALQNDSTFAMAYTGLAWVYWDKHYWETYLSGNFLDSVLVLTDMALSYDSKLSEAYTLKGRYYNDTGNKERAIEELNKAIKLNPNDWMAYHRAGLVYDNYDNVKSIEYLHKAKSLYHGSQLPGILRDLGGAYHQVGFYEKAKYYAEEAFKLDKDSLANYYFLGYLEHQLGNFERLVESVKKIHEIDSNYLGAQTYRDLGEEYMFLHQSEKSLTCFKEWLKKRPKTLDDQDYFGLHRIGWAYLQAGYKKEANHYFNEIIEFCEKIKKLGRVSIDKLRPAYDLAGAYAMMGDRVKAYENLRIWAKIPVCPLWWLTYLKYDPLFDSIRRDTEFQQILKEMEDKYQGEHERVKKWLVENKML